MSQSFPDTIDPTDTSGTELAALLTAWAAAVNTQNSGASEPTYKAAGTIWLDTTTATAWALKLYDGTSWLTIATINSTAHSILGTGQSSGTWTPGIAFGGAATGITYGTRNANYIQVGKLCTVNYSITLTNKGSATGTATITGLPATVANTTGQSFGSGGHFNSSGLTTGSSLFVGIPNTSTLAINVGTLSGGYAAQTDANFSNTSVVAGSLTFLTA